MFCASATGTCDQSDEEAEFVNLIEYEAVGKNDDENEDEECNVSDVGKHSFFLAETHDDLTLLCREGIPDTECDNNDDIDDDDDDDDVDIAADNEVLETMLNSGECAMSDFELNQLTNSSGARTILTDITTNETEEMVESVTDIGDVAIDANDSAAYVEADPDLLEYHTATAAETVNLLLPELPSTAALDCGNFVDFDEFNLCLNNILSEDDDEVMAGISKSSTIMTTTSNKSWQKMLTTSSNSASHHLSYEDEEDILNIAQINNDMDLAFRNQPSTSTSANAHRTTAIVANSETTSTSYHQQQQANSGVQKA